VIVPQRSLSLLVKILRSIRDKGVFETALKIVRQPTIQHPFKTAVARKQLRYIVESISVEERFTKIFNKKYWGDEESVSGLGSRLEYTANLRKHLPQLFDKFSIRTIFDAPCGDFYWMKLVLQETNKHYLGGDIVRPLIDRNNSLYRTPDWEFLHFNIITDRFPKADLWICRDCMFHLSFEDTFQAFRRFVESNIPYVLTTTHKTAEGFRNSNVETGDFRLIDLFSDPYFFDPNVLFRFDDYIQPHPPREMCLWSRDQIIRSLSMRR
jgi:hypothetical protein